MSATTELPYELHTYGGGAFVIFNVGDQIALPLIALARATLRTQSGGEVVVLEFPQVEVAIEGRALAELFDHLFAGRVKRISCAHDSTCEITAIRLAETS